MGLTNAQRLQITRTIVNTAIDATQLNGAPASSYAVLNNNNTFNNNQTISGSLNVSKIGRAHV